MEVYASTTHDPEKIKFGFAQKMEEKLNFQKEKSSSVFSKKAHHGSFYFAYDERICKKILTRKNQIFLKKKFVESF